MFSSFKIFVLIYSTSAYSQFGENLSEGCPQQRKTPESSRRVSRGPAGLCFFWRAGFSVPLRGVSWLAVHYSVPSYSGRNFPFRGAK